LSATIDLGKAHVTTLAGLMKKGILSVAMLVVASGPTLAMHDTTQADAEGELLTARLGGFEGAVNKHGGHGLDTWVAALVLTPRDGVVLGVSSLSDLAESGAELVHTFTAQLAIEF